MTTLYGSNTCRSCCPFGEFAAAGRTSDAIRNARVACPAVASGSFLRLGRTGDGGADGHLAALAHNGHLNAGLRAFLRVDGHRGILRCDGLRALVGIAALHYGPRIGITALRVWIRPGERHG